jgi:hypothetical protein
MNQGVTVDPLTVWLFGDCLRYQIVHGVVSTSVEEEQH